MCEIYGYAELEDEYNNDLFKKETLAEINGSKRKVAILQNHENLGSAIFAPSTKFESSKQRLIEPTKISAEVETRVTITWGGTDGVKTTYEGRAKASDEKGNSAQLNYNRDENGESEAYISTSHKVEKD